jgi:tetratricopeptide (TPR) repeat protein
LTALQANGQAEQPSLENPSDTFVPLRPRTQQELAQREALTLYGLGYLRQREDRLIEAMHLFEEALQLDPQSCPLRKALIPLYMALGRSPEALAASSQALNLDPEDYQTWSIYAQQLKNHGRLPEARAALSRALACSGVADLPELRVQLYFDLGVWCEEAQDYDAAVQAFSQVVKILDNPHCLSELDGFDRHSLAEQAANTYERMVKICIQARQYERALGLFAEGSKNYPVLARRLNYSLAKIHANQGHQQEALRYLDDYLTIQPQGAEAYELWIGLIKQLERTEEILPSLEQYAQRDAHNVPLHLLLASQYASVGQLAKAEKVYDELAKDGPTQEIYHAMFTMYSKGPAGSMEKLLTRFDEAVRKSSRSGERADGDPQSAAQARAMLATLRQDIDLDKALLPAAVRYVQAGNAPLHAQTELFLAALAGRTHRLDEAEFFYRRCLQNDAARDREVAVYGGLIQILWQARKYDSLVVLCRQGLEKTPAANRALFHNNLSRALALLGKDEEAIAEADKAVAMSTSDARLAARLSRMFVLERAERWQQATAEGQALLKEYTQPGEINETRHRLANVYSTMGDYAHAEEQLQLILKADPNDATANNDLGYYWADQGRNLEEAERLIRKALELDRLQKKSVATMMEEDNSDNAAFLDSLGWVLFRRGELEAARAQLEKAATLGRDGEDPVIWDHLGAVCSQLGDQRRARAAWEKALRLYESEKRRKPDKHSQEIKRKLESLERDEPCQDTPTGQPSSTKKGPSMPSAASCSASSAGRSLSRPATAAAIPRRT